MDTIYREGDAWKGFLRSAVPSAPFVAVAALASALK